ncbi:HAD family hydrolase [Saccharicrinis sp. GN24d3]|uniref:HAD family hydrolase n=1 Tax=Saccharicrinis sp. GN24d3 TaxID=3458416 RepID=UPI0040351107
MMKGILFDMDGVIVDSEEFIFEAAKIMFEEHGIKIKPEDALPFVGTGENNYIKGIGKINNFRVDISRDKARTYAIYNEITSGKLKPLPGTIKFIQDCKRNGLKLALASSADKIKIMINLREIGLPDNTFDSIISGEDVERKKPFPDIYILAAKQLGLQAHECLVIEDAISGIKAGKSSGARCLALTTSFPEEKLNEADWVCDSLENVPSEALQ